MKAARQLHGVLLLVWALVLPLGAAAADVAIGSAGSYPLSQQLSYFEDASGSLGVADVLRQDFKPVANATPGANFGFSRSAIWFRVTLAASPQSPPDWLLELAYPLVDHIELFTPIPGGYQRQQTGDNLPFAGRPLAHRNFVLPVKLQAGATTTVYLRLRTEGALSAPLTLWQPLALWQQDQAAYLAFGLYFGLLVGLLLYNLLLFASVRDPSYLLYVFFVAAMALFQVSLTGLGTQFLWSGQLWWGMHSPLVGTVAVASLGLLFARSFLSSAARTPLIDKLILLEIVSFLAVMAVGLTVSYTVATHINTALILLTVVTLLAAGGVGMRRNNPGARNFVIAWTVLLLSVGVLSLHNLGLLPTNVFTANAVLFGSALEMVLLSFALADRINVARRFKQQAQSRIAAEQAMVQALSVSQEQLRTSLQEREVILDNSIAGIAFLTSEGRFRWANPKMMEILGARGQEIDSMERFYLSREQYLAVGRAVADHVRRGEVYETEMQIRQWDGAAIWISVSGKGVVLEGRVRGTVWVIMDITQRKHLEEELRAALAVHEEKAGWT